MPNFGIGIGDAQQEDATLHNQPVSEKKKSILEIKDGDYVNKSEVFEDTQMENILELKQINQSYDKGKTWVIRDLNFLIEDKPKQGQFVTILGPSGCGKSTVLRYISGLQKPTSGEILFYDKPELQQVGMVFQQYSSFPWKSVIENVAFGLQCKGISKKERYDRAMEMIQLVGLEGHEYKFAQYPTLSGGQLQRVAIARSLITESPILLMDEPFGALDIYTRVSMQNLVTKLWQKLSEKHEDTTIIFVTHDIPEAVYLSDEIWLMKRNPGQIIHRIQTPFSLVKDQQIKRSIEFTKFVYDIEDQIRGTEKDNKIKGLVKHGEIVK